MYCFHCHLTPYRIKFNSNITPAYKSSLVATPALEPKSSPATKESKPSCGGDRCCPVPEGQGSWGLIM
ncbi:hypothetical protein L1987_05078 [Smallanthus sonchifolius]|uniref:Uncharacterized protein n=1 Tax=Smallanthus sonchifolius TaxID=185202 RepID=A0ACB9JUM6_9ASTR|nr:hypothetical protein L1987_05078 [Smallanthus sonchifolius]